MSADISMEYDPCDGCEEQICLNKDSWMQCIWDLPKYSEKELQCLEY
ncbi:MAG: hypothetical protein GY853_00795 [PVC group bacterium]|nr:hypothetical protein [PVC group bacterium]